MPCPLREVGYLQDLPDFVPEGDIELVPREHLVVICTGTQGEPALQWQGLRLALMSRFRWKLAIR